MDILLAETSNKKFFDVSLLKLISLLLLLGVTMQARSNASASLLASVVGQAAGACESVYQ